jgi:hypothetical protein
VGTDHTLFAALVAAAAEATGSRAGTT